MSADASTKIQVNVKSPGGTLLNIYAANTTELERGLELLAQKAQDILDVERLFAGVATVVNAGLTQSTATEVPVTVVQAPAPAVVQAPAQTGNGPACKHGPMQFRESKPGAAKTWRAWMCSTPKGTPDQCEPQWIKG